MAYKVGLNPTDGGGGDVGRRNPMEEDRMRHDITSHSYQIEEKENSEEARIISLKIISEWEGTIFSIVFWK